MKPKNLDLKQWIKYNKLVELKNTELFLIFFIYLHFIKFDKKIYNQNQF